MAENIYVSVKKYQILVCSLTLTNTGYKTRKFWPFPKRQVLDLSKLKEFADDNFEFVRNAESFPNGYKTLWEKEKLLVTSNFSFSHCVFKRLILQTRKYQACLGRG